MALVYTRITHYQGLVVLPPAHHRVDAAAGARAELLRMLMPKKIIAAGAESQAPASFEEAMAELAQLVTQMEAGQLPLEASVAAYQRGSELVKYCAGQLDRVEAQVKVLEGDMLKPFSEAGLDEAAA
jgi:exodeoxyribonuclease VII small subunit